MFLKLAQPCSLGTPAYVITPKGAKEAFALEKLKHIDLVTMELSMKGNTYVSYPYFFEQRWDTPSLIYKK